MKLKEEIEGLEQSIAHLKKLKEAKEHQQDCIDKGKPVPVTMAGCPGGYYDSGNGQCELDS